MSANIRTPAIDIVVESRQWDGKAETTARRALEETAIAVGANFKDHALSVLLTDDAAVRRLNAQWRNIDKPTNVLSFPPAPARAKRRAQAARRHRDRLRNHGARGQDERKPFADHLVAPRRPWISPPVGLRSRNRWRSRDMEQLERVILSRLGVPDPYGAATSLTHDIQG